MLRHALLAGIALVAFRAPAPEPIFIEPPVSADRPEIRFSGNVGVIDGTTLRLPHGTP